MLAAAIALAITSVATAQTILPATPDASFPACGLSCSNLINAQTLCVPPTAPVTNQYYYDQCFCQSALLTSLYGSPDGLCDAECPVETDRQLLQSWYQSFCGQVAQTIIPTVAGASSSSSLIDTSTTVVVTQPETSSAAIPTTLATSPSSQSVVVVTITSTNSIPVVTASNVPTTGPSATNGATSGSWIDQHWRWVLMAGILIAAFILFSLLAVWFKRRHRRRTEHKRVVASGFPPMREKKNTRSSTATLEDMFGPHQHMHMTKGWQYTNDQHKVLGGGMLAAARQKSRERKRDRSAKGKGRQNSPMPELDVSRISKRNTSKTTLAKKNEERERSRGRDKRKPGEFSGGFGDKVIGRDVDAIEKG